MPNAPPKSRVGCWKLPIAMLIVKSLVAFPTRNSMRQLVFLSWAKLTKGLAPRKLAPPATLGRILGNPAPGGLPKYRYVGIRPKCRLGVGAANSYRDVEAATADAEPSEAEDDASRGSPDWR